jgi:hypothetical protein
MWLVVPDQLPTAVFFLSTSCPCFTLLCFNALCHYTPLLNLHLLTLGLTRIFWLRSVTQPPVYSIISYRNIVFYHSTVTVTDKHAPFSGTRLGRKTRAWCTVCYDQDIPAS